MRSRRSAGVELLAVALLIAIGGCGGGSSSTTASSQPSSRTAGANAGDDSIQTFGSEATGAERTEITAGMRNYLGGITAGDYVQACDSIAKLVRGQLSDLVPGPAGRHGCPTTLAAILSGGAAAVARGQAAGAVSAVRVDGSRAFVVFRAPGARLYSITMLREGGAWKVAALSSNVLVP